MIKILIVDDHPIVRKGIHDTICEEPGMSVAGEARDGLEALELIRKKSFDAIILDLSLPKLGGLQVLEQIKISYPQLPVLILSIHSEEQYATRSLKMGAAGFLPKDTAPDVLIAAIKKIVAGGKFVTPSQAENVLLQFERNQTTPHDNLSNREFMVLKMITEGKSQAEISDILNISVKTVSTYRSRILEKLGLSNNAELIKYGIEHSLLENVD